MHPSSSACDTWRVGASLNPEPLRQKKTRAETMDVTDIKREVATLSDRLGKTQDYL
ncbi:MAG: hypothetical protein SWY16_21175 [Cyanobacteriota bacterium]|nr:hypothetical protein [Cyanobacteriota bacterium]